MQRSSSLKRYTPLRARRNKPEVRIGKVSGKVRLSGDAMERLRGDCYRRDEARCRDCGRSTHFFAYYDGDPLAYDMAHIKSKGAGGSDTLDNVVTKCHRCHMREHAGLTPEGL